MKSLFSQFFARHRLVAPAQSTMHAVDALRQIAGRFHHVAERLDGPQALQIIEPQVARLIGQGADDAGAVGKLNGQQIGDRNIVRQLEIVAARRAAGLPAAVAGGGSRGRSC